MRWTSFVDIYNIYWHLFLTRFFMSLSNCNFQIFGRNFSRKANIAKSVRKLIYRRTIINVTGILLFDKGIVCLRNLKAASWIPSTSSHASLGGDVLSERLPRSFPWYGPTRVTLWHTFCDICTPEDRYRTV